MDYIGKKITIINNKFGILLDLVDFWKISFENNKLF